MPGGKKHLPRRVPEGMRLRAVPGGSGLKYYVDDEPHDILGDLAIVITDPTGREPRGEMVLTAQEDFYGPRTYRVDQVLVDPKYRGQGLGLALYGVALVALKLKLTAGMEQTPAGQAMWKSMLQIPGVEIYGFVEVDSPELKKQIQAAGGWPVRHQGQEYGMAVPVALKQGRVDSTVPGAEIYGPETHTLVARWRGAQTVREQAEHREGIDVEEHEDVEDPSALWITAASHGRELGRVKFYRQGDTVVAQSLEVKPEYRGQGIARIMYDFAKEQGYRILRSADQTAAGAGFWDRYRGRTGVWEDKLNEIKE